MSEFIQLVTIGIMIGSIYGLVALGFVLIYKASRIFNLAQGEMLMFFAYLIYAMLVQFNLSFPLAILLTLVAVCAFGIAVEHFPLRPMLGQPIFAILMVTIGLAVILKGVTFLTWGYGGPVKSYPVGLIPRTPISIGSITVSQVHMWGFVSCMLLFLALTLLFRFTKTGLRMRGTAEGHQLAQSTGVNVNAVISITWIVAALVSAVGGFFLANMQGLNFNLCIIGLAALPAALLGGFDSLRGAIIGGIIIGIAECLVGGYISGIGVRLVVPYILVILILIVRPYGLFGLKRIERV